MTEFAITESALESQGPSETSPVPAIVANQLTKNYRTGFWLNQKVNSLQSCSVTVYQGETFGLLGPNGAGKTTLLKILLGIIPPSSGSGEVFGYPLGHQQSKAKIGYLPENAYYYDYLTGWELLEFMGSIFELEPKVRRQRIADLLDLVGLPQSVARKKQLPQYSKGMVQRIGLAQALINDPEIVFLDEPMSGLDPVGRYQIRELILLLKKQGKTVFFNTHILSDVELICDRIGILNKGELIALGSLQELLGTTNSYQVKGQGGDINLLSSLLTHFSHEADYWHGEFAGDLPSFLSQLQLQNVNLLSMQLARQSLEEFFIERIKQSHGKEKDPEKSPMVEI